MKREVSTEKNGIKITFANKPNETTDFFPVPVFPDQSLQDNAVNYVKNKLAESQDKKNIVIHVVGYSTAENAKEEFKESARENAKIAAKAMLSAIRDYKKPSGSSIQISLEISGNKDTYPEFTKILQSGIYNKKGKDFASEVKIHAGDQKLVLR